jgi:tetratricopeptide (TPR) repeat protein
MSAHVHFSSLLDALPQQVWKADAQGRLLWMNARLAEALNRPALPAPLARWLHTDDRDAFAAAWDQAQRNGRFEMEYRLGHNWVLAQAQRLPDSPLWLGTRTDINARRAVELCRTWTELDLSNADAWRCLGRAQQALGLHQEALTSFRKAKQHDPLDRSLDVAIDGAQRGIVADFQNRYRR